MNQNEFLNVFLEQLELNKKKAFLTKSKGLQIIMNCEECTLIINNGDEYDMCSYCQRVWHSMCNGILCRNNIIRYGEYTRCTIVDCMYCVNKNKKIS